MSPSPNIEGDVPPLSHMDRRRWCNRIRPILISPIDDKLRGTRTMFLLTGLTVVAGCAKRTHTSCSVGIDDGAFSLVFTSHDVTRTCAAVFCMYDKHCMSLIEIGQVLLTRETHQRLPKQRRIYYCPRGSGHRCNKR